MLQNELFTDWSVPLNLKSACPSAVFKWVMFGVLESSKAMVVRLIVKEETMAMLHAESARNERL